VLDTLDSYLYPCLHLHRPVDGSQNVVSSHRFRSPRTSQPPQFVGIGSNVEHVVSVVVVMMLVLVVVVLIKVDVVQVDSVVVVVLGVTSQDAVVVFTSISGQLGLFPSQTRDYYTKPINNLPRSHFKPTST
jgi:hypothetical protein